MIRRGNWRISFEPTASNSQSVAVGVFGLRLILHLVLRRINVVPRRLFLFVTLLALGCSSTPSNTPLPASPDNITLSVPSMH